MRTCGGGLQCRDETRDLRSARDSKSNQRLACFGAGKMTLANDGLNRESDVGIADDFFEKGLAHKKGAGWQTARGTDDVPDEDARSIRQ